MTYSCFNISDCEDCHELYEDDCPSHPLTVIKDSPVPPKCKHRAKLSLPSGLVVKEAGIEGAGEGVWAKKFFPKGVRFGPYGGEIVNEKVGKESGYAWEVSGLRVESLFVRTDWDCHVWCKF